VVDPSHRTCYAGQARAQTCRYERRKNATLESAFSRSGGIQNFHWIFCHCIYSEPILGVLGYNNNRLETRLQLNHVPVHKIHSAKVTKMLTTSLGAGLARIVGLRA